MTAIQSLTMELAKITLAQADCIHESGYIKNECKYKYNLLVRKARALREAIDWLQTMESWQPRKV